jgi:F-type H+-transporting ATPase subunit epsilon
MKLGVYSLQKVLFQGDATSVNCNTRSGEITILDRHEPLISILEKGTIKIIDVSGQEFYIPVKSGFLEVDSGSQAKIMVEEDRPETLKANTSK